MLFVIVLLRAQATYWLGRGVTAGVLHTRCADKVTGPRTTKAIASLNRWGPPLVTVSFLTIGLQTVVNAAAGLIRMPWIRYTIAMLIGCVAWALIYATVGIAAVEAGLALAAHSPWALVAACCWPSSVSSSRVDRHPASSGGGPLHQPPTPTAADGRPAARSTALAVPRPADVVVTTRSGR